MNWSGHGLMDLQGYDAFMSGKISDYPLPEELLQRSLDALKDHPPDTLKLRKQQKPFPKEWLLY